MMMMMIVEQSVESELAGETVVLGENLSQCLLSTINPACPDPGSNSGRRGGKPATNRLSYDTAVRTKIRYTLHSILHELLLTTREKLA
jgi:hypothetical protein